MGGRSRMMPRRGRIMIPGIPIHVVQRGNNRSACFVSDEDRAFYLHHLGRLLPRVGCTLHAYCLMANHVHLLISGDEATACALLMKHAAQLHSQYFNRRYGRTGSLWEGRFRSCLVQTEVYLLRCYRYIELNPVRAGMVGHPMLHPWSSYAMNATGKPQGIVTPHPEYLRLGATDKERSAVYQDWVLSGVPAEQLDDIRTATNGGYALGDRSFCNAMAIASGRRVTKGEPGRPKSKSEKRGLSLI